MFNSLRWSLQLWHAGLLALVLTGFGAVSYFEIQQARYRDVDAQLDASVRLLLKTLVYPPRPPRGPGAFPGGGPPRDFPPRMQQNGVPPDMPPDGGPDGPRFDRRRGDGRGGRGFGGPPGGPDFGPNGEDAPVEADVPKDVAQRFGDGEAGTMYYYIWDYDRDTTKTSRAASDVPDPGPRPPSALNPGPGPRFGFGPPLNADPPVFRTRDDLREAYMNGPAGTRLLVGKSLRPEQAELRRSAWLLTATGAGVLLIGLAGGWLLSLRAVRPIQTITATAKEISATNLSRRINLAGTQTELGTLASVLNDTFSRLESAFQQQVRFTADASHELRTPLAVIHTNAQLALSRDRTAEEYRKTLESCLRASTRMKGLVDSLLVLAKADAGSLSFERTHFDLRDITEDAVSLLTPLAEEKHVKLESHLNSVELSADPSRIAQVVTNLLTNAIRYNREGGRVHITVESAGPDAVLTIADTGVGIPAENQPHLFERFYRVDPARSRELGGSGLGLAICKSIVEGHGGTITFASEPGSGTTFTVRLPCSEPQA